MNAGRTLLWMALLLASCGARTPLRPTDAFIDDDPWLKVDAGSARRDAGTDARDAGARDAGARDAGAPDRR